jgi:PadR family transcriptional regulator PadR
LEGGALVQAWATQVRKGLIELWLLGHLSQGQSYGYQLRELLFESGGQKVPGATVYLILARFRREGWITVHGGYSPLGPRRLYYRLSRKGAQRLRQMRRYWQAIVRATRKSFGAKNSTGARRSPPRVSGQV